MMLDLADKKSNETTPDELDILKGVERILKLEPKDRTTRNISLLHRYFQNNFYFRRQAELYEDKTI